MKIWFQNRRTKFKRKYTSDVETLASHYYSSLGIGGLARPMVVGDRLWLFSQPVNGPPAPIESLLLSNVPPTPSSAASSQQPPPPHFSPAASRNFAGMHGEIRSTLISQQRQPLDYSGALHSHYLSKSIRHEYFGKYGGQPAPASMATDFRIVKTHEENFHPKSNGLADLESRFGHNSSLFNDQSNRLHEAFISDTKSTTSSDEIDCEEIEINDEN